MKKLLLLCLLSLSGIATLEAQIIVPRYSFETPDDFTRHNDIIIECCNWLMTTPLEDSAFIMDEVIRFIMEWSTGSPDVLILIDDHYMPYYESNTIFMLWHIAGSSKYQLERGIYAASKDEIVESTVAGMNAVIDFYEANRSLLDKDKNIEKMAKLRNKGKMERFVAKRIDKTMTDEELERMNRGRYSDRDMTSNTDE